MRMCWSISIASKDGPEPAPAGRKMTRRGGSGWSRMQPMFPRLSTWIRFVGRLVIPTRDELDERDVDEVTVEVRVSEGTVCCSRITLPVDELRVRWSDRLSCEKDARGFRTGA
jgi:hypothetical protein